MDDKGRQKKNLVGESIAAQTAAEYDEDTLPRFPHAALTEYLNRRNGGENAHAGHRGRLRESAKQDDDLSGLSDVELVELLLSFFIPQKDTNVIAHRLIDRFGSVVGVMSAPQEELVLFSHITAQIASMLPALFTLCRMNGYRNLRLRNRAEAADFFGIAYLGKGTGTYIAFMDDDLNVRAIENFVSEGVPMREILSSACKYHCKYAFIARRETEMFPQTFNIAEEVGELADMMFDMNVTMLDYLIFTDYGYYTIGTPRRERGSRPLYIFVPAVRFLRAPYMFEAVMSGGGALYAGRESAEPMEDFAEQLCRVVKN